VLDQAFASLFEQLTQGGPEAVISGLILFCVLLLWERKRLLDTIVKKDEKLDRMADEYEAANKMVADALKSLTQVMYELKGRLF
jgi:K+ transporter